MWKAKDTMSNQYDDKDVDAMCEHDDATQSDDDYKNEWNIACPKCGEGCEEIAIQIPVWVRLTPDGSEVQDGDHDWSEDSPAECVSCGFKGTVKDFETKEEL